MLFDANNEKITVHAKLTAKKDKFDELLKALEIWAAETRDDPGCEYSEVIQNIDNPSLITLVEKYTNYAAFKAHMQLPAIRNFIDNLKSILVEETHVSFHITRIDSIGSIADEFNMDELSFREDLMDRKS